MKKETKIIKDHGVNICDVCEGDGYVMISCCGYDLKPNIGETDMCPSCGEHCGEEREDCEECYSTGGFIKGSQEDPADKDDRLYHEEQDNIAMEKAKETK